MGIRAKCLDGRRLSLTGEKGGSLREGGGFFWDI